MDERLGKAGKRWWWIYRNISLLYVTGYLKVVTEFLHKKVGFAFDRYMSTCHNIYMVEWDNSTCWGGSPIFVCVVVKMEEEDKIEEELEIEKRLERLEKRIRRNGGAKSTAFLLPDVFRFWLQDFAEDVVFDVFGLHRRWEYGILHKSLEQVHGEGEAEDNEERNSLLD